MDHLRRWLRRNFYVAMALAMAAIVVYGFTQTFEANLQHPPYARPWILYVHAVVFPLWIVLFVTQASVVRRGATRLHRSIGPFGLALGAVLPVVALSTAIVMDRLHAAHGEQPYFYTAFFVVHVVDELTFVVLVGLAALLRAIPAYHARLMFVATCILMDAPFSRFPVFQARPFAITLAISYLCVDLLVLCGVARDMVVEGRVGTVYRYALPAVAIGQAVAVGLFAAPPPWWLEIVHRIVGA